MRAWAGFAIALFLMGVAWADRPNLRGTVAGPDGEGIAGATVYVWTAGVKEGTSPYCPSCYPDCGKRAETDETGAFTIESLDPALIFKILAVAEGHLPVFEEGVDPASDTVKMTLAPIPEERQSPAQSVRGRVVAPDGNPIAGATVEPFGMAKGSGSTYGGQRRADVDAIAVTNDEGEFLITAAKPDLTVYATVTARSFARQKVHDLTTGGASHTITLDPGTTISGYVRQAGGGIPDVEMGLAQIDRNAHTFLGEYIVATFDNGFFEIPNVPANDTYYLYGKIDSLQGRGAIPVREIKTGSVASRVDAGEIVPEQGHTLAGRVVLSDGGTIPPKTRLMISRDDAWDGTFCELGPDGSFEARDLPSGPYEIHLRIPGYGMSSKNATYLRSSLVGVITRDNKSLMILLEPGEEPREFKAWDQRQALRESEIKGWDPE